MGFSCGLSCQRVADFSGELAARAAREPYRGLGDGADDTRWPRSGQAPALNRAYAFVRSERFGAAASELAEGLRRKGYEAGEAARAIELRQATLPGMDGEGSLFGRSDAVFLDRGGRMPTRRANGDRLRFPGWPRKSRGSSSSLRTTPTTRSKDRKGQTAPFSSQDIQLTIKKLFT